MKKGDYAVKSPSKPVLGNRTRITIDSREMVYTTVSFKLPEELGFGDIPIEAIIFNPDVDHSEFIKNKSIIFTQNGQVHGFEGQSFISQDLGFSLLKRHMLIHVNCTIIPTSLRHDLFMSNRTHLKGGPKTDNLKDAIISKLKSSDELRRTNNERKNLLLQDSKNDKGLVERFLSKLPVDKDVINLLKKDGSLNFLKQHGQVRKPENKNADKQKRLNRFPSIFNLNLKTDKDGKKYKTIPLNKHGRLEIETDVENDYLFRPVEKGSFKIEVLQKRNKTDQPVNPNPNPRPNEPVDVINISREGPVNGTIKLILKPNEKAKIGDEVTIKAILSSPGKDFECVFTVKVDEKISAPKTETKKKTETFPNLPTPYKSYENPIDNEGIPWNRPDLNWGGKDIVKVITNSDDGDLMVESIIINMDSFVLKSFLSKNRISDEKEIKFNKDKYFLSIYLHSLFLFSILQKMRNEDEKLEPIEIDEFISSLIKPYASFLLYENYHVTKLAFDE